MTEEEIFASLEKINSSIQLFSSEEMIALEDNRCANLGIILKGTVEVKKNYASGKAVVMARLKEGDTFGEVLIFGTINHYPASIFAIDQTKIMFIPQKDILTLCHENTTFMENFMRMLSNKTIILNNKIQLLTFGNIRQKICFYLLEQYKIKKDTKIELTISKKNLAEEMGIQRPSLSRELIKMRTEGLIDFHKNIIELKDLCEIEKTII